MRTSRRAFVAGGLAGLSLASGARAAVPLERTGKALVLTGGVNRGAYQAGVIEGLVESAGVRDGEPLDYDLIAGCSIGAMNGYLVATAQYSRLQGVWNALPDLPLFELKEPFRSIGVPSSGVGTRLFAAIALALGVVKDVKGVVDPAVIKATLDTFVDVRGPVHIPAYFSATNVTRKRTEVFVARGSGPVGSPKQARQDQVLAGGTHFVLHPVAPASIRAALFASAALPVAFDPVPIPRDDGTNGFDEYVDGGIADNVPIDIARRCANQIDVVAVDAPEDPDEDGNYANAADIGTAVFEIMKTRIVQQSVMLAYAESLLAAGAPRSAELSEFGADELPIDARVLRPARPLPGALGDFRDRKALEEMRARGKADALGGWVEFQPTRTFGSY